MIQQVLENLPRHKLSRKALSPCLSQRNYITHKHFTKEGMKRCASWAVGGGGFYNRRSENAKAPPSGSR